MIIKILGKQYEAEEEYEPIWVEGREYIPLKVYYSKSELKDMVLAVDVKTGHKECFHRIDIGREARKINMTDRVPWTFEEIEIIKDELRNGKSSGEIAKNEKLNRHTENAIYTRANDIKTKMIWRKELGTERKREPRFNIKF